MAGKRDIAWVADTLVTQLKADMPGKLTGLEVEYNDGVSLEQIPDENYFISERARIPGFPFVAVVPEETDAVPFSGENRYNIEYHTLTIAIARTANEDEDVLKRQTLRTVRGVEEVLLSAHTLGGSVNDCLILSKQYGPMLGSSNGLLQEGQVTVRVETSEE